MGLELTHVNLVCLRTDRLTVAPHPRITPDARTVKVTSFQTWFDGKQDTESGLLPDQKLQVQINFVTRRSSTFFPKNMSLFDNEKRALGARFPVSHTLEVRGVAAKIEPFGCYKVSPFEGAGWDLLRGKPSTG